MKTLFIYLLVAVSWSVAQAKQVPGLVFTLNGDTLEGKIAIRGKPCKLKYSALYKLCKAVEFTDAKGMKFTYKPSEIKGFAILCNKEVKHRFVSVPLNKTITNDHTGYAGMFGVSDEMDVVFAKIASDVGYLHHYTFTGYSASFIGGKPSGNIFTLQLLKKSDEAQANVLDSRPRHQKEQLSLYLGDCPKVKAVLGVADFSIKKGLVFLVSDYNNWYAKQQGN